MLMATLFSVFVIFYSLSFKKQTKGHEVNLTAFIQLDEFNF